MLSTIFSNISTILASIGLILATSSFISGLQLVRGASRIELYIHRYNGFASITLYCILALLSITGGNIGAWSLTAWLSGLSIIILKLYIVRRRKKAFKYVSWIGATLILVWLYLVYIHIPV